MHKTDNYTLYAYGRMISDRQRARPYIEALRRVVRPDSTVLDIGTGAGYFAFLAIKFGAVRVYAAEPSYAIEVARLCANDVPGSDRISWIQDVSTEIELPEKVDIVIGDLHGTLPFYNANIASMIDARLRHLKQGGAIIPARDVLRLVPAQAPEEYAGLDHPWTRDDCGLSLQTGRSFVANEWWRAKPEPVRAENLLSTPATWGVIDYSTVESANLDGNPTWVIERPGTMHGYYVWFDSEIAQGLGCSNAPDLPELVYGRAFFPLEQGVDVKPGDRVQTRFSVKLMGAEHVYRWDTRIIEADGNAKIAFKQSTFRSRPINREYLQRTLPDYVPTLNLDGQMAHAVIQGMAQSQPLGQIAETLSACFPQQFNSASTALSHVVKLALKYSEDDRLARPVQIGEHG